MMQLQYMTPLAGSPAAEQASLTEQLAAVHHAIAERYPCVDRVALASYDAATDMLKTFVSSNTDAAPLTHYSARISDVPSLANLVTSRQTRIVNDLSASFQGHSAHTDWLKEHQYRSSLTIPIFLGPNLVAMLFFDSKTVAAFDERNCGFLEVIANLIAKLYILQLQVVHNISGIVNIASGLARIRDLETGQHLARMAAYSRLMAVRLADAHDLDDETIEYIHLFAPLHDIGKIGIPDRVLLKPGKLDEAEWKIMRSHVEIGESIAAQMGDELRLCNSDAFLIMQHIIGGHHERGDGSGYPRGLFLEEIPIAARIVAVADVYDALSTRRPYKQAWSEPEVAAELQKEAALKRLDAECVDALLSAREERLQIQQRFADTAG